LHFRQTQSGSGKNAIDALCNAGHPVQMVEDYSDLMGHAGAVSRHADDTLDGASDPHRKGGAAWF